mgnify:CR=1 FL=1|jgi:hypothetical protein
MVTHAPANIEAFQDLAIWLDSHTPGEVRDALASQATSPWRHAPEREHHDSLHIEAEYFAFELEAQGDTPKVGLVLWKDEGQLRVTNVVPVDTGQLSIRQYNHALRLFHERVASPVASRLGLRIEISKDRESLTDWMSSGAADLLRRFSATANKSTGSSHPSDRARWMAFLIAAHKERLQIAEKLKRWLIEVDRWPQERAIELVIEYEFGSELLVQYDQQRD